MAITFNLKCNSKVKYDVENSDIWQQFSVSIVETKAIISWLTLLNKATS